MLRCAKTLISYYTRLKWKPSEKIIVTYNVLRRGFYNSYEPLNIVALFQVADTD